MTNSSTNAAQKTSGTASGELKKKALAQELSDVLDVIRLHPTLFPGRTEHARISLSLESGERLEMEFTGQFASTPTQDQDGHICLGNYIETATFQPFLSIDDLDLSPTTKVAAQSLLKQFPNDVKFTSGRRSIAKQAAAMAPNVLKKRNWIQLTYAETPQRAALQKWVDEHPDATTAAAISAGLESVMNSWSEAQQRSFSRHITGDAFDLQPVVGEQSDKIKEAIGKLPKFHKFLPKEGGLEIWHVQFDVDA